jgi:hypothetical protein
VKGLRAETHQLKELVDALPCGTAQLRCPRPRRPAITIRTFSSEEYCRRVARPIPYRLLGFLLMQFHFRSHLRSLRG